MKSHKDDARADANIQIQTEMYNLYLDFMAILSGNTTTNLTDANKALFVHNQGRAHGIGRC